MEEDLGLVILKIILLIFSGVGLTFHLLALKNVEVAQKVDEEFSKELGIKKKFIPWLEDYRMQMHERLIRSRSYHVLATVFLFILVLLISKL